MKHYRILAILIPCVLALVATPFFDVDVAQAKHSRQATGAAKPAKSPAKSAKSAAPAKSAKSSAKSAKPAKSAKVAKAAVAEPKAGTAKHKKGKRTAAKGRHAAAAAAAAENEEGDLGVCNVTGGLRVKSAILYDVNTREVLYEQNADFQIPPASLTKVLTLYLIFDAIRQGRLRPWDMVEVSERAATQGGSNMRLRRGESDKVTDLIMGIAIASANDACMAMADHLQGGNVDSFVALMNDTAKRLGMTNSVFMNPNGLPADGQLTTARDMLHLATNYLEQFPKALTIHSMQFFTHNNRQRHNANSLLSTYEGADGLKTGFVCASGYNIIATAKRGDTRLIAVVLGSRSPGVRQRETTKLLDRGFKLVAAKRQASQHAAAATSAPAATAQPVATAQPAVQQAQP